MFRLKPRIYAHAQAGYILSLMAPLWGLIVVLVVAFNSFSPGVQAAQSTYLNFQARLLTNSGAVVPDGFYHVEFKLYNVVSGGTAQWTETWSSADNSNRVRVVNGYLTANLGADTAFPGTIAWDQQQWLTMNIGGTASSASWDGEMNPRILLTALPYAFKSAETLSVKKVDGANVGTLSFDTVANNPAILLPDASGTVCLQSSASCGFLTGAATDYIQNGTSTQTANYNIQSAASGSIAALISGASGQSVDILQVKADGITNPVLSVNTSSVAVGGVLKVTNTDGSSGVEIRAGGIGLNNTFIGINSGIANTTGFANSSLGVGTLQNNTEGFGNIGLGNFSLFSNITGDNNVGIGINALYANGDGSANTAIGYLSSSANTSGTDNTSVGNQSLASNTTGNKNTALGMFAGYTDQLDAGFVTLANLQNATMVGYNAQSHASNSLILGGAGSSAVNVGIGTTSPTDLFSISPVYYSTGTARRFNGSGTVQGIGTAWTTTMIGMEIIFGDGHKSTIGSVTGGTTLDMGLAATVSDPVGGVSYRIHNRNFYVTNSGSAAFRSSSNSTTAFQVQNAAGSSILTVDTSGATISLAGDTTVASGKYLRLTGGVTGTRPSSPTAGTLYYDTSTNQLLQYNGTKWVSDRSTSTKIVAANNSSQAAKDAADYVADGTGDQIEINAALTAASGGSVYLMEGTYVANATILIPNNTTLSGAGRGTLIELADLDATDNLIENSDTSTGTGVAIRDLRLDGRDDLNTAGTQYGIRLFGMGDGTGASARAGANISNLSVEDFRAAGVLISSSDNTTITNVTAVGNTDGIYIGSSNTMLLSGNISQGNSSDGIVLESVTNSTVSNNSVQENAETGIHIYTASKNIISGNKIDDNGGGSNNNGINLFSSDFNLISSNNIADTACTLSCYAINITNSTSDKNQLEGNRFSGSAANAASINDAGTGTIYANQQTNSTTSTNSDVSDFRLRGSANSTTAFQIQNAAAAPDTLFTADTTNNRLYVGNATASAGTDTTLLVVDSAATGNAPTGVNGGMFYDTTLGKFRCYEGGAWKDCDTNSAATATLQDAYNNSSTPATITTTSSTKDVIIKSGVGFNSSSLFQVQNAAGNPVINADTVNNRIGIGTTSPSVQLHISGAAGDSARLALDNTATGGQRWDLISATNSLHGVADGTLLFWNDDAGASRASLSSGGNFSVAGQLQINGTQISSANLSNDSNLAKLNGTGPQVFSGNNRFTGTVVTHIDSTAAFQIQNTSSQTLLVADTQNQRVAVGPAAVAANAVLTVGTNTTAASGGIYFGTDTSLYRSAGNTLRTGGAFTSGGLLTGLAGATVSGATISLNESSNFSTNINTGTSSGTVNIGNNSGNTTVSIDSGTSAINIGTGAQARSVNIGTGGANQALTLGSLTSASTTNIHSGTGGINLYASGSSNTGVLVKHTNNSTSAFQIQNSAGTPDTLFRADTTNNRIYVGNSAASSSSESTLFVLDNATTTNLPTGVNGGLVYDSTLNKFKIYENGAYKILCNATDQGCGSGGTTTLQDAYNNSTSPATITTTSSTKDIVIKSGVGFNSSSLFQIQNASSQTLLVADTNNQRVAIGPAAVAANAVLTVGTDTTGASGGIYFGTDTSLYRSAGNTLTTGGAFTAGGLLTGQAGLTITGGAINLNATTSGAITIGNNTNNTAVTIDSGTSAINIGTGAQARTVNLATGGAVQTLTLGSTNGASSTLIQGGTGNVTLNASGSSNTGTIIKTSNNSTSAFQIQNSAGSPDVLFRADSTNNRLYVGNSTASAGADTTLLVIDSSSTTNLPTGVNGGMVYDSTDNKFKVYENGQYKVLCNTTDLNCGVAGSSQSLQDAYNNSSTPATITSTSSTKDIIFKSGATYNSSSLFQIQSSGSDVLFKADTANNRLYVGNSTASSGADSTLLVVDSASTTNLPTGVNGGLIYDSTDNKFKVYENGAYKTLCNTSDLGCGSAGTSQSLQDAYNNSSTPALITTTGATKDIIFRSGIGLNSASVFQIQNASSQTLLVADTQNQRVAIGPASAPANGVLTVGANTTAASGGLYFGTDSNLYRSAAATLRSDGNLELGEGSDRTFKVQGRTTNAAGNALTISAGNAGAGASAFAGGPLYLQGGNAAGTGNANGGDIILSGGTGVGTGTKGLTIIDIPAFTTATNTTCSSNCTISQSNVDGNGNVIVDSTATDIEITLPDPTNTTAGRILYITAANGSSDFTLVVNGGGTGNQIAMRANTSATMVWNGSDWTAAGASSSTTLQAAYNNTLTSAGGAEILLNNSASSNGLTIRNNADNPIMGGVFEVQSSIGTNLLSVNNNAVEYVSNGGAETAGASSSTFPSGTWEAAPAGGTVSRNTNLSNVATGQASVQVDTTASSHGIKNNLTAGLATNTTYQLSLTGKLSSGSFTTVDVYYTRNGGTTLTPCASAQSFVTTGWSKVTCTFTTDGTTATDPDVLIRQSDGTARTFWIDNLSVTLSTTVSTPPNVQIGGGIYGGTPTLLTLDRSSSAPVANGNDVYFGSMYYDTTSGRIQCYEADGWGACGSAPDNFVNLVPEYAGAVLNGTGVGTMSADFCANSGALSVNSSLCASGQALNYYRWTSPQATQQTYSLYVTYQLPAAFKNFANDNTITLTGRTDSTTNGALTYQVFRSEGGSLTACGTETAVTTAANVWQTVGINGNEYTGCGFSSASANNNVIFKINVKANSNANVYVGTLSFTTIGQ